MKKLILLIISILFISNISFAEDFEIEGPINIENIIKSKETEKQLLQNIGSALNKANASISKTADNLSSLKELFSQEEPEYQKDEDTSDEFNLDYYLNILKDGSWKEKAYAYLEKLGENINNTNNEIQGFSGNELTGPILWFLINALSFVFATVLCSVSLVTAMETSKFKLVKKIYNHEKDMEEKAFLKDIAPAPKYVPVKVNIKEKPARKIVQVKESPFIMTCNKQEWIELGKGAIMGLEQYTADDEFKQVYGYSQKKSMPINTRPLEVAMVEADKAMGHLVNVNQSEESLLSSLIKGKSADKYSGNMMNGNKSVMLSTDIAYLIALSDAGLDKDKKELWSNNSWN